MSRRSHKIVVRESTGQRLIEQSRVRLLCIGLFFILCFGSIGLRMVDVAVIQRGKTAKSQPAPTVQPVSVSE